MKVLITGVAGFIGFHICRKLLLENYTVVGIDNINAYYDPQLKYARLRELGIDLPENAEESVENYYENSAANLRFYKLNIADKKSILELFASEGFDIVCHMAAQAGVRYSLEAPDEYIKSNIHGFHSILEGCRTHPVEHLIYASSSSVYGSNTSIPFREEDQVDTPISLYAATKKSNELMAHTYSHLFNIPSTGLRFFTVYGPWGRPDMALFLFTEAMLKNKPIKVYNYGKMERDFTYINDVVQTVFLIVREGFTVKPDQKVPYNIYNLGKGNPNALMDFISEIELKLGKESQKEFEALQPGDVVKTWADIRSIVQDYKYQPVTSIKAGVSNFIDWYMKFYYK